MRTRIFARVVVTVLVTLALAHIARAQTLADKVPADSFVYLGWKGTDTPGNGYEGSHLQAVLRESKFRDVITQGMAKLTEMMAKDDPQAGPNLESAKIILAPFFKYQSALFVRPGVSKDVPVRAGVLCMAGADAKSLVAELNKAIDRDPEAKRHIRVLESGDLVALLIGFSDADAATTVLSKDDRDKSLAASAAFGGAVKHPSLTGGFDPFASLFIDFESGLSIINRAVEQESPEAMETWARVRDALGFDGLKRLLVAGRFDGPGWAGMSYVEAPAPRKGLVKLFDSKPIDPATMKMIPATAAGAQVMQFDFAALVNEVRNVFAAADQENGPQMFDQAIGAAQMMLGVNPITDVLEPLGDTWVVFSDESIGGNGPDGLILINKLDDAAKAERGFGALWRVGSNMLNGMRNAPPGVALKQETIQNVKVSTVQTPSVAINIAIHNGRLVAGINSDTVVKAALAPEPANGFDQNTKFAALTKQLAGDKQLTAFRFVDLPVTAPIMHEELTASWKMIQGLAADQDFQLPDEILPPLKTVQAHVFPAGEVSWVDAGGFHSRSTSPFPGADFYSNQPNSSLAQVGVGALGISVLLPSLNRARETANRVKCASNERQIGQAMLMFANDHNGAYPDDLGTLLLTQDITIDVFLCPSSDNSLPPGSDKWTPQQMAEWINQNSSYIYAGKGLRNDTPEDKMLVIEKLDNHSHDGINCLFGDGHVEFVQPREPNWQQVEELSKQGK